jgi:hypothetical protein
VNQERRRPGLVRDAIVDYLRRIYPASSNVQAIHAAVCETLQSDVPASSVRSYLRLNTPETFQRTDRGTYKLSSSE